MSQKQTLKVLDVRKNTSDAVTITLEKPESGFEYKSGQFLTLILQLGSEEYRRSYSFCSSPEKDDFLSVTVKKVEGGKVSNFLNDILRAGGALDVLPPMGNFLLDPDRFNQRHVVLIAGGSGITPLFSILKTVLISEPQSMVSLIDVNSTEDAIIYGPELEALKAEYPDRIRVIHHLTKSEVEGKAQKKGFLGLKKSGSKSKELLGRMDKAKLISYLKELHIEPSDPAEFYLCGPKGMMDTAIEGLKESGIDSARIHKESFFADSPTVGLDGGDHATRKVKVVLYGETHKFEVTDKSILLTALDLGIDMPFSCQSGLCTACMGKCTSGKVEMEFSDSLMPEQIAEGFILTCVGHPKSDDVVVEIE